MQLTCWALFKPAGDSAYIELGDLDGHKVMTMRDGGFVTEQGYGYRRRIRHNTAVIGLDYEFKLNEQFKEVLAMQNVGAAGADFSAIGGVGSGLITVNAAQQGKSYFVGIGVGGEIFHFFNVLTVTLAVGGTPMVEGIDYEVDRPNGLIYIIPGGGIANGATIQFAYTNGAAVDYNTTTRLSKANAVGGTFVLLERDQHAPNGTPRRITTFAGFYWVEGSEEHDGQKPASRMLKILPATKPALAYLKV